MKTATWQGKQKMEVRSVDGPKILEPTDAIIHITVTATCGPDLYLYHHDEAVLEKGYAIGYELMGIVEEMEPQVQALKKRQRVVVPFSISCDHCHFYLNYMESQRDELNPDQLCGGLFGFDKPNGNYWGGQMEYLRAPYADSTSFAVPDNGLPDEKVLFLSDILSTAYWSVENAGVKKAIQL